ncbi:unnamed protein product, partial [Brassica oleracea]
MSFSSRWGCMCRNERAVSLAIEPNEKLQRILNRHKDLLSGKITVPGRSTTSNGHKKLELNASTANSSISNPTHLNLGDEEEETEHERINRPLIRPLPSKELLHGGGDSHSQS